MRFLVLFSLVALYACGGPSNDPASTGSSATATPPPAPPRAIPAPLPGIDISALADAEKRTFHDIVEAVNSPCGEPVSISRCVRESVACGGCVHAARYLTRLLSEGYPADAAKQMIELRYTPANQKTLSLEGCAFRGASSARITIVEFADFECPHCKLAHEMFDGLFEDLQFASTVRLCYKYFPLESHPNARAAARAAVAAGNQGKFWQMHDLLYDHQTELSPAKFVEFATSLQLDLARFNADYDLPATDARVGRDRAEGEAVGINGTPAVYVNGRSYEGSLDPHSVRAYVDEELTR